MPAPGYAIVPTMDLVDQALEAWPSLKLDRDHLRSAIEALPSKNAERAAELALGLACANGDHTALMILERTYLSALPRQLAHMKLDEDTVDEVVQEVRRKLLVGDPPKIGEYAGKGSLRGLLKVTATRAAISLIRKTGRVAPGDDPVIDASQSHDLEASFLKREYRGVFRDSFEAAIRGLDRHERNLLRLHFLGKVTLQQLATMYGVHRATIVRRIASVREALEKETRGKMRDALKLDARELDSVMELIRSRLDVSVERMFHTIDS